MADHKVPHKMTQHFVSDLFLKHKRLLFSIASQYTADIYEQEDIIQEALIRIVQKEETLVQLSENVQISYLKRTVQNTAINLLKKKNRDQKRELSYYSNFLDQPCPASSLEDILISKDNKSQFYETFNMLPEQDREILINKYLLELSDSEIAHIINCKPGSVRMKLTRARRALLALVKSGGSQNG